ncbi:hypothetical protein AB0175_25710, partial [Klebsiella pneumoniae]|nr:hypothetical protein [Klebsiella pneumoniae subsp. ozaenae]
MVTISQVSDFYSAPVQKSQMSHFAASLPLGQVDNINATIMGGEAGVSYKLTDSWKTDASLAYSWGRNMEDGKPLPQMPPLE